MKKRLHIGILLLILTLLLSISQGDTYIEAEANGVQSHLDGKQTRRASKRSSIRTQQRPTDVSIIELIANPQAYNGRFIRVVGFVSIKFEGTAIYLHQDDYRYGIFRNGLWLTVSKSNLIDCKGCHERYAIIEGTFDAQNTGHFGVYNGGIKDIQRLEIQDGLNLSQ